ELNKGITTEPQVVYLLAGIRKLIERDGIGNKYAALKFHSDWALHSKLEGRAAKAVLNLFDEAQPLLKEGTRLHELPEPIRGEIGRIYQMKYFREELTEFLQAYRLPALTWDGWTYFLHLYVQVIEDIPLLVQDTPTAPQNISRITVHFEAAKETIKG